MSPKFIFKSDFQRSFLKDYVGAVVEMEHKEEASMDMLVKQTQVMRR